MVQRKTKLKAMQNGKEVEIEGVDVPVAKSTEYWSEFELEDGTVLRIKVSLLGVVRIPNQWDPEGNPLYILKNGQMVNIVKVPPDLKKPEVTND
jgi:hypothetical protein